MRRTSVMGILCLMAFCITPSRALSALGGRTTVSILTSSHTTHRVVALSFDDGPSQYTAQILATLTRYHARATFFVVGAHAQAQPGLVRQEALSGDEIGNHTYNHVDLRYYTADGIKYQLETTQSVIWSAAHVRPVWFRPPYGDVDLRVAGVAASLGLGTVIWSVDPRDWTLPGAPVIVARVLTQARPGSIVLLHDGGGYRGETAAALPFILRALKARGYRFITLDEMFFPGHAGGGRPSHPVCGSCNRNWPV